MRLARKRIGQFSLISTKILSSKKVVCPNIVVFNTPLYSELFSEICQNIR